MVRAPVWVAWRRNAQGERASKISSEGNFWRSRGPRLARQSCQRSKDEALTRASERNHQEELRAGRLGPRRSPCAFRRQATHTGAPNVAASPRLLCTPVARVARLAGVPRGRPPGSCEPCHPANWGHSPIPEQMGWVLPRSSGKNHQEELRAGRRSLAARHARSRSLQHPPPRPRPAASFPCASRWERLHFPRWIGSQDPEVLPLGTPSKLATLATRGLASGDWLQRWGRRCGNANGERRGPRRPARSSSWWFLSEAREP